jgi:hypothetical protein
VGAGDAVERNFEECLGKCQAVFVAKIRRVQTVAEKNIQTLPGQPPALRAFGQSSLQVVRGADRTTPALPAPRLLELPIAALALRC